jgi:twin arginine-targeting protein translocase, TatA/E family
MLTTFGFLTPMTAGILLIIALVIFGPGKLPELGKSLGKGIREFKAASEGEPEQVEAKTVKIEKDKVE